jgi:hypothetical protein
LPELWAGRHANPHRSEDRARAIAPISKTVIRSKNTVTPLMPEEQVYRVRNKTRGSIEYAEAAEEPREETRNLPYQVV